MSDKSDKRGWRCGACDEISLFPHDEMVDYCPSCMRDGEQGDMEEITDRLTEDVVLEMIYALHDIAEANSAMWKNRYSQGTIKDQSYLRLQVCVRAATKALGWACDNFSLHMAKVEEKNSKMENLERYYKLKN